MLNNKPLQDLVVDASAATGVYTDYLINKDQLKKSVIQNRDIYHYNWFHSDNFSNYGADYDQENHNNLLSGVPMAGIPMTWTFNGATMVPGNYQHYTFVVFLRKVYLSPAVISIV